MQFSTDYVLEESFKWIQSKLPADRGMAVNRDKLTEHHVSRVWRCVGSLVGETLICGRALRIDGFGTFTLDRKGSPILLLSQDFVNQTQAVGEDGGVPGDVVTCRLNIARLAKDANVERPRAEAVVTAVKRTVSNLIQKGGKLALKFLPAGTFHCSGHPGKRCSMKFLPEFRMELASLKQRAANFGTPGRAESDVSIGTKIGRLSRADHSKDKGPTKRSSSTPANLKRRGPAGKPTEKRNGDVPITYWDEGKRTMYSEERQFVKENINKFSNSHKAFSFKDEKPKSSKEVPPRPKTQEQRPASAGRAGGHRPLIPPYAVDAAVADSTPREVTLARLAKLPIIERIREGIRGRNNNLTLKTLTRCFKIMDDDGSSTLNQAELSKGLIDWGLKFSPDELAQAFKRLDKDHNGSISLEELLEAVAPKMNQRRLGLVRMVFERLDRDGSGSITSDDLREFYKPESHVGYISGEKSVDEILHELLENWDTGVYDGVVTWKEFRNYYQKISLNIDDDNYFELMLRNSWRLPGGKGVAENTANKRDLVQRDGKWVVELVDRGNLTTPVRQRGSVKQSLLNTYGSTGTFQDAETSSTQDDFYDTLAVSSSRSEITSQDPREVLSKTIASKKDGLAQIRKITFTPQKTFEEFIRILGASTLQEHVRIPVSHLTQRLMQLDRSLTRAQAENVAKTADPNNLAYIDVHWLYDQLCERFGKQKQEARPQAILEKVQLKIIEAGGDAGVKKLARMLGLSADRPDARVTKMQLKDGFQRFGILINVRDLDHLMTIYDTDKSGFVEWSELIAKIRPELNARRRKAVNDVFTELDSAGQGEVPVRDLCSQYNFKYHPGVMNGTANIPQASREFQHRWTNQPGGVVTREDFLDYYRDMSIFVNGDDYFEEMVKNAWRVGRPRTSSSRGSQFSTDNEPSKSRFQKENKAPKNVPANSGMVHRSPATPVKHDGSAIKEIFLSGQSYGVPRQLGPSPEKRQERLEKAVEIQRLFRGHLARKIAAKEHRVKANIEQQEAAKAAEDSLPRSKMFKPKRANLKTTYGF